ncbi:hypothetical protein ACWKTZ_23065 [Bacillus cereus]
MLGPFYSFSNDNFNKRTTSRDFEGDTLILVKPGKTKLQKHLEREPLNKKVFKK